jgi:hypothetical protein
VASYHRGMSNGPSLAEQGYVKVQMSDDDGYTETAWAVRVSPDKDHFRLDNSPFYAYRVSAEDVVEARRVADGFYEFVRVVERSGNRTVRLILRDEDKDAPSGQRILDGIRDLGCSYEGMFSSLISITVPPGVDLAADATYLTATGRDWEHADPKYEDLHGES